MSPLNALLPLDFLSRYVQYTIQSDYSLYNSNKNKMKQLKIKTKECLSRIVHSQYFPCLVVLLIFGMFSTFDAMAQSDAAGAGGFQTASNTIRSYEKQVRTLMNAIGAVIAIVGAFNVYFKMQNGDQDVKKTIMLTIGGCIAFVALAQMLPVFFSD